MKSITCQRTFCRPLSCDLGDHRLELLVPSVLLGIQHPMLMDYPAHIAWLMLSNEVMCISLWLRAEHPLDGLHGCDQTVLFCGREFAEQRGDLIACARIKRSEFFLPFLRQT